jgi:hypothetical protein
MVGRERQDRRPILLALALANNDLPSFEIDDLRRTTRSNRLRRPLATDPLDTAGFGHPCVPPDDDGIVSAGTSNRRYNPKTMP